MWIAFTSFHVHCLPCSRYFTVISVWRLRTRQHKCVKYFSYMLAALNSQSKKSTCCKPHYPSKFIIFSISVTFHCWLMMSATASNNNNKTYPVIRAYHTTLYIPNLIWHFISSKNRMLMNNVRISFVVHIFNLSMGFRRWHLCYRNTDLYFHYWIRARQTFCLSLSVSPPPPLSYFAAHIITQCAHGTFII